MTAAEPPQVGAPWTRLGEGASGPTWSGVLEDGTLVAATRLRRGAVPPDLAELARLGPSGAKALVPIHLVRAEGAARWVFSELAGGIPLNALMGRSRLAPMCAVAVAMGALDALAALHQVGLWHGSLHACNVQIGPDGTVRLMNYQLTPRAELSDARLRAADIQAVGVLLCAMLRVRLDRGEPAESAPRGRAPETELVALARRMARGPLTRRPTAYAAVDARLAVWEAAGRLATRRLQSRAKDRLAEMVAGPTTAGAPDPRPQAAVAERTLPLSRRLPPLGRLVAGLSAAALMAGLIAMAPMALVRTALSFHGSVGVASSAALAAPGPTRSGEEDLRGEPVPVAPAWTPTIPALAPAAAGQVSNVLLRLVDPGCAAGSSCLIHVEIWFAPAPRSRLVSWTVRSVPPCGGSPVGVGAGSFTAQPGWTHVVSENAVALPPLTPQALVAVSALPDQAASSPLILGSAPATCG